jgi:hypothetical protein
MQGSSTINRRNGHCTNNQKYSITGYLNQATILNFIHKIRVSGLSQLLLMDILRAMIVVSVPIKSIIMRINPS